MKIAKIIVSEKKIGDISGELVVILAGCDKKRNIITDITFEKLVAYVGDLNEFSGKKEEALLLYSLPVNTELSISAKRILMIGTGDVEQDLMETEISELLRVAGGTVAEYCKKSKVNRVAVVVPSFMNISEEIIGEKLTEGILLGEYSFQKYKKDKESVEDSYSGLDKIEFYTERFAKKIRKGCEKGRNSAIATRTARDMANEPGNGWTAEDFAKYARKISKSMDLKCTVLDKEALIKLKMGGILAVNQGSSEPAKMVIVDYNPGNTKDTILLVGKGLTFDSGGISLKPAQGMMDMKYDMCGGAAALSVMEAIGRERPSVRVVSIIPTTDNMGGASALKPGDIITHYNGITSEIENTDAEGRLILADALAYGIEKYKPTCVIDLATLTGAVIIALGHHHSGLMSNNEQLTEAIVNSGKAAGEPVWRLPLGPEYAKQLKSQVADIKNTGGRPGGSITAAEYLHKFVGDTPWAHLDIAGTAWDFTEKSYIPKGPSGIGTRTLLYLIRSWKRGLLNE